MKYLVLALYALFVTACSTLEVLPPQQNEVTHIVVKAKKQDGVNTSVEIAEPDKIGQIINFVNDRTQDWKAPFSSELDGQYELSFYRDSRFVGNFYVGDDYFGRDYGTPWLRNATQREITDIVELMDLDIVVPESNVRCSNNHLSTLNSLITSAELFSSQLNETSFNEISPSYPRWCATEVNQTKYKIYQSNVSKKRIVIERLVEGEDAQRFGPFKSN